MAGVVLAQPARLDDPAAAGVELRQRLAQALGAGCADLVALEDLRRLVLGVGQVGDRRHGVAVVARLRIHRDVLPGQARLHLDHFLGLDAQRRGRST